MHVSLNRMRVFIYTYCIQLTRMIGPYVGLGSLLLLSDAYDDIFFQFLFGLGPAARGAWGGQRF